MDLYQQCRTEEEIEAGFRRLQGELEQQIQLKLADTKEKLLEHFDEDVHALLKVEYDEALMTLDAVGRKLWRLTQSVLKDQAIFNEEDLCFTLHECSE